MSFHPWAGISEGCRRIGHGRLRVAGSPVGGLGRRPVGSVAREAHRDQQRARSDRPQLALFRAGRRRRRVAADYSCARSMPAFASGSPKLPLVRERGYRDFSPALQSARLIRRCDPPPGRQLLRDEPAIPCCSVGAVVHHAEIARSARACALNCIANHWPWSFVAQSFDGHMPLRIVQPLRLAVVAL